MSESSGSGKSGGPASLRKPSQAGRGRRCCLAPTCSTTGWPASAGVIDAGCAHTSIVVGRRKQRELPRFKWINTALANQKTAINGAHKHFAFGKYAGSYLGAFAWRFNHRFHLRSLFSELLFDFARTPPLREREIRAGCAL